MTAAAPLLRKPSAPSAASPRKVNLLQRLSVEEDLKQAAAAPPSAHFAAGAAGGAPVGGAPDGNGHGSDVVGRMRAGWMQADFAASGVLTRNADAAAGATSGAAYTSGAGADVAGVLQRKLAIGSTDDPLEREADQVAKQVMSFAGQGEPRRAPVRVQRFAGTAAAAEAASAPASVDRVLASPGQRLRDNLRQDMESRFGHDFSHVRIHTDSAATQSARELNAQAYTVGREVVFAKGQYAPDTAPGRKLLAHELTHVVQQGGGSERVVRSVPRSVAQEPVQGALVQRNPADTPEDEAGGSALINRVARAIGDATAEASPVPLPRTAIATLAAAELGFLDQTYQRLITEGDYWRIATRLLPLAVPPRSIVTSGRFALGFLEGVVSPVVGLYHLVAGVCEATSAAAQWLTGLPDRYPALVREGAALVAELARVESEAATLAAGLRDPAQARSFVLALLAASDALQEQMVAAGQRAGRHAADSAVQEFLTGDLNQIAQTVGVVTGTVTIEVVLLVFTEGIGNLITRIGEIARILRPLSRGAEAFAAVAGRIGGAITALEGLIGLLMSRTVLRPLRPLLEAVEPLILRLRSFGRALLEAGEEAAARSLARAAERATAGGERRAVETAVERVPATRATAPRPPEPLPAPSPSVPRQATPEVAPPPPSSPVVAGGGGGGGRRLPGATAEGEGEAFRYEFHPETPPPEVVRGGPSGVRPEASARPTRPPPPAPAPPRQAADVGEAVEGATLGTGTAGRSPSAPEELGSAPRRPEADDPHLADPQRLRPEASLRGAAEAARARGLPAEVVDSGYVYTREDFPDVVPETGLTRPRSARPAPPLADERARGVAGRRPTTAPDPADVQNSTLAGDLHLIEDHIAALNSGRPPGSRWTFEDVRINRTQVAEGVAGPARASMRTRPDLQFTIRDPEGNAQRFLIEYDRSPPTRALGHARGILERDPTTIVILKVIGFE
jgi:hypothetical protein